MHQSDSGGVPNTTLECLPLLPKLRNLPIRTQLTPVLQNALGTCCTRAVRPKICSIPGSIIIVCYQPNFCSKLPVCHHFHTYLDKIANQVCCQSDHGEDHSQLRSSKYEESKAAIKQPSHSRSGNNNLSMSTRYHPGLNHDISHMWLAFTILHVESKDSM